VKVAFGPTNTSSSSVIPLQSWTPDLIVTRSPIRTPPSMNTWSHTLAPAPTTAPGRMWVKAQTRVSAPIRAPFSTIALGWMRGEATERGL
jgi:hypothetical protein